VFAAVPVVWDFVTSGLESGLVIGWLGGTFWLLARRRLASTGGLRAAAFVIGCGPLVRPDLGLFAVAFALVLIVIRLHGAADRPAAREWIVLPLIAGTLPVGYQVFRMGFFAAVVPNAALAKEASLAYWSQGWRYTLDFIGPYALWLPTLVAAAWVAALLTRARRAGDRITTALILGPTLAALAHWLYVTRVGGDFMHGRLLVPTLFAFLLPVATVVVPARSRPIWRIAGLAAVWGWAVMCALWFRVPSAGRGAPVRWGIADEHGFYQRQTSTRNPIAISTYARQPRAVRFVLALSTFGRAVVVKEDAGLVRLASLSPSVRPSVPMVLGLPNVGILGYLAGLDTHVVDQLGLADPIASRMALTSRGRPGHEKWLSRDWIAGRFGDPKATSLPAPAVDVARAVGCGDLARLLRAVNDPLTVSRFLANVRASWALSRLRIPADPASARDRFCSAPAGS
jgi:arabinofuranosyltransferase